MTEPWAPVDEVAAHLSVERCCICRCSDAYGVPAHKIGNLWKANRLERDWWVRGCGALDLSQPAASTVVLWKKPMGTR